MEGLSIIIPTLNEERYVGKLLECLCRQTYKNFEVIVVDGHSDDKTKAVVRKFNDRLSLKLINSDNRNVAYQRNLGASKAKYERLLFLDADVVMDNRFIENSLEQLKTEAVGIPKYVPLSRKPKFRIIFNSINFWFRLTSKIRPCGIGMGIFSNNKLHIEFDRRLVMAEDMDYIRKCCRHKRLYV
ncbi:MAG: glycosyltransferase family 2 protein, partial [Nanoarchaeota archaeon]|nr:glycosyltransferase family 2 protein [Nanoarchaeota archaeon]